MTDTDPNATGPDGLEPVAGTCAHCGGVQLVKSHVQAEDVELDTAGKKPSGDVVVCTSCGAVQAKKPKPKPKPKPKAKAKGKKGGK